VKLLFFIALLMPTIAHARPEYAVREKLTCINCHVNPMGGGHRKIFGKVFGSRGKGLALSTSSDLYYGDMRSIFVRREGDNSEGVNGLSIMTAAGSLNIPVIEAGEHNKLNTNVVVSHDFGKLSSGTKNTYLLFSDPELEGFFTTAMFGKFPPPFGLFTDEHRTYTKLQTMTTWNRDFSMGGVISGDPFEVTHYDLAVTNGFRNTTFNTDDETYAVIGNLRWNPNSLPFLLGASWISEYTRMKSQGRSPYGWSLYSAIDLHSITDKVVPLSILGEIVDARFYNTDRNSNISAKFIDVTANQAYRDAVNNQFSRGYYLQLKYEILPTLQLNYKYDLLLLSRSYKDDGYFRHGIGARYQFGSNLSLTARVERARAKRPGLNQTGTLWADTDGFFAFLRFWL